MKFLKFLTLAVVIAFTTILTSCETEDVDYEKVLTENGTWTKDAENFSVTPDNLGNQIAAAFVVSFMDDNYTFSTDGTYTSETALGTDNEGTWELSGEDMLVLDRESEYSEEYQLTGTENTLKWVLSTSDDDGTTVKITIPMN